MNKQREMPFYSAVREVRYAPQEVINSFESYRDAVVWAWSNRPCHGMTEAKDQLLCAITIGLHPPHMNRCVKPNSKAPMKLDPDLLPAFESYTGWNAPTQYILKIKKMTAMEQVIAERKAA